MIGKKFTFLRRLGIDMHTIYMLLSGVEEHIVLPNSKVRFFFGNSLLLSYDERVFQEGRGFLPKPLGKRRCARTCESAYPL